MGANDAQTTKALLEADAWPGPSLVIAYSTCIAHGIDMSKSMTHQKDAVKSGYWPLYRFQPSEIEDGQPFKLDSTQAVDAGPRLRRRRRPASRSSPARSRSGPADLAAAGPGRRRRALALLRAAGRPCTAACPTSTTTPKPGRRPTLDPARQRRHGRRGVTVDLRTRYLGLELRSPIVASASPLTGEPDSRPPARGGGRRGDRPALALRGGDRRRGDRAQPVARGGRGQLRRGARLLPGHRRRSPAPATATWPGSGRSRRKRPFP